MSAGAELSAEDPMSDEGSLAEYRRKRDFARTPEPSGENARRAGDLFITPADGTDLPGAVRADLPPFPGFQLAMPVDEPVSGDDWLHEIKYDGYRVACRVDGGKIDLFSRTGRSIGGTLPRIVSRVARLPLRNGWLDGEIVVFRPDGTTSFTGLQSARRRGDDSSITYVVFDLLHLDGFDLRSVPLKERKKALALLFSEGEGDAVTFADHVKGEGEAFYREACRLRLEGVVSKRADSRYQAGRSAQWLKLKCGKGQELVIGGFTESGAGRPFGSLLAGYYRGNDLVFCGKIKTGYSAATQKTLIAILSRHEQKVPPFVNPPSGPEYRNPHWLRPELVAEVDYTELTPGGILRNASFKGLRDDKDPRQVVLESISPEPRPIPSPAVKEPYVFPREHITRSDLLRYYSLVAGRMLPHLCHRPLTLIVCRENIFACKFVKHATSLPAEVRAIAIRGHDEPYVAVDGREGLLALVKAGTVEFHCWGSRYATLEYPDRLVFDLDPPEAGMPWERLAEGVLLVRKHLLEVGLEGFLMTTGGKGYYVVVPLRPEKRWREVTSFARRFAEGMESLYPERFTARSLKYERQGRIYVDWMRNGRGSNAAEAYTVRARAGAPIATPILWEELSAGVRPDQFTMESIEERLAGQGEDPWKGFFGAAGVWKG